MPKKEHAQTVNQTISNVMDSRPIISNVSDAGAAKSDSFGNVLTSENETNFPGSSSGSKKAILSADLHSFPDTANPKSNESKMTGFVKSQNTALISQRSATFFMMAPTSEKTTASFHS